MNKSDYPAFQVRQLDGRVQGSLVRCSLDELPPGEVLIRVEWSSVNYKDALAATGNGSLIRTFPLIPGIDVAGVVECSDSTDFPPGKAVLVTGYTLGIERDGGYAGYVRVPTDWVVALPAGIDTRTAMLLGTAGFTVALCLRRLRDNGQEPKQGPIVVSGATGGVGMIAVTLLSHLGYEVHAITGKQDMHALLKDLGAAKVFAPDELFASHRPLQRSLWAGAIDNVGGGLLADILSAIQPWGNVASVGLAASSALPTTVMPFILRGVSLIGISSANCPPHWRVESWQYLADNMPDWLLRKLPQSEVALRQLPEVFAAMLQRTTTGRTLVRIED